MEDVENTNFTNPYKVRKPDDDKYTTHPSWGQNLLLHFCNFCDNASIHGYKFFGERKRNIFEKIYWLLVILGAIFGSSFLIYNTYMRWATSPIIVTFAKTETPIWKIPFPAVTICSESATDPSTFNFTDTYLKYIKNVATTEEDDELFKIFSLICNEDLDFINETETKYVTLMQIFELYTAFSYSGQNYCRWMGENIDCIDALTLLPTSEGICTTYEAFSYSGQNYCRWMGENIDCIDALTLLPTSEGICTTFNMLEKNEIFSFYEEQFVSGKLNMKTRLWTLEEGYPPAVGLNAYPRRTIISGVNGGLQMDFEVGEESIDHLCSDIQGYKIALHHPAEVPNMDRFFRVPLDQVVITGIKPRMITTSDDIKSYKSEVRQCYFPGEKNLTLYRIYSQQNCLSECINKFILSRCNCMPFYLSATGEKICGAGSTRCANKAKVEYLQKEVNLKLKNGKDDISSECNCLPACTSIEFDSETSQNDWDWKKEHRIIHNYSDAYYKRNHRSRLLVYYKDLQFMTSERHELFGTLDFLANCGGLLGLCCGFSFISLMEIIYYLTFRLWSNIYKFGCKVWV